MKTSPWRSRVPQQRTSPITSEVSIESQRSFAFAPACAGYLSSVLYGAKRHADVRVARQARRLARLARPAQQRK